LTNKSFLQIIAADFSLRWPRLENLCQRGLLYAQQT